MICLIDLRDCSYQGDFPTVRTMCGSEFFGRQDLISLKDPNLSAKGYCRGCMTAAWGKSIGYIYMIKPDEIAHGSDDDDA